MLILIVYLQKHYRFIMDTLSNDEPTWPPEIKVYLKPPSYYGKGKEIVLTQETLCCSENDADSENSSDNAIHLSMTSIINHQPDSVEFFSFTLDKKPYSLTPNGLIGSITPNLTEKVQSLDLLQNSVFSPLYRPNYNFQPNDLAKSCLLTLYLDVPRVNLNTHSNIVRPAVYHTGNPYQAINYANNVEFYAKIRYPFSFSCQTVKTRSLKRNDFSFLFLKEGKDLVNVDTVPTTTLFILKPFRLCTHEFHAIKALYFEPLRKRKIGVYCPLQRPMQISLARSLCPDQTYKYYLVLKGVRREHESHTTSFFLNWIADQPEFNLPGQNNKVFTTHTYVFLTDITYNTKKVLDATCLEWTCPFFISNPILTTYDPHEVIIDLENMLMESPIFLSNQEITTFLPTSNFWKNTTQNYPRKVKCENGETAYEILAQEPNSQQIHVLRVQNSLNNCQIPIYLSTPSYQVIGIITTITKEQLRQAKINRDLADEERCTWENVMSYYPYRVTYKPQSYLIKYRKTLLQVEMINEKQN